MKACTKCKAVKPLDQFGKNQLWCKSCKHKNYLANKETHQLKCKQWVLDNPEASKEIKRNSYLKHKSRYSEKCKALYLENSDYYKAKSLKRYVENRESIRLQSRIKYENLPYSEKRKIALKAQLNDKLHPHKANARTALRRSRLLKATPSWVDKEHRLMIRNLYHYARFMQITTNIIHHVDHIVPLVRGGTNDISNSLAKFGQLVNSLLEDQCRTCRRFAIK